jgi:ABC-type multidrug transport system ATPase subunit
LDLIADRKLVGTWSGEIYINKRIRSPWFNRESAYVLQDDVHISTLTVEETLLFSAWTRMEEGTSIDKRKQRVAMLLDMMGLTHVKDSIVGDPMRKGISGGQLKRLSIAVEIISLPHLIFLDEPTSGLDSSISLEVMSAVRKLSDQGRTCVSTIHQPSPEVYALFDKAVLLSAGRVIYCGAADEAVAHFTRPELGYKYIAGQNPAEFIIDVCGGQIFADGKDYPRQPPELETLFRKSKFYTPPADAASFRDAPEPEVTFARRHSTTKLTQLKMLMSRTWLAATRDSTDMKAQFGKNFVVGLLVGIVFQGQADVSTPLYVNGVPTADVSNTTSLLFFGMMYCLISNTQAIPALCSRNQIYRRELASFAYAASPYWLASSITLLPILALNHYLFIILTYFLSGFPADASYFFYYSFLLLLANMTSYYFAMFLAAASGSAQLAFAVFPVTFLFLSMFSGFTITVNTIPPGWSWAPYLSYARWVFEGLMVNQWAGRYSEDDEVGADTGDGDTVLSDYGFSNYSKGNSFWIVILNMGFIMLITYYAMRPPTNNLKKVEDADVDMLDTGAASGSVTKKKKKTAGRSYYTSSNLDESLLTKEDLALAHTETFGPRVTYDVAWYRQSTGQVQMSRGCRLVFRNLTYSVPNKLDKKSRISLLKGVSGRAHPGEMCALMGASGAGKSTLLDVLAGRKTTGEISGDILFNGSERSASVMRSSAYVMQDNVHIGVLTVRQTLSYAAELRLSERMSAQTKLKRVDKILDMLGLAEHADTLVGNEYIRGISGGQLKRLSIGVEIIHLPDLIFLDEPTTGLDSAISYEVMAAVRNLANQNRTVICTIHQPSPATYMLFDKLMLMAEGRVIYFGPSRDVVNYFVTSPYHFNYVSGSNPADYVIAVAGSFLHSSEGKRVSGQELASLYNSSDLCRVFLENIDTMIAMDLAAVSNNNHSKDLSDDDEAGPSAAITIAAGQSHSKLPTSATGTADDSLYTTSTWNQTKVLCHRVIVKTIKNRRPVVVTFFRHIFVGLLYGTVFYQLSTGTENASYTDRLAVMFFSLIFMILGHQQAIPALFEDRLIFYRERGARAYGALPYWISSWFLQIPLVAMNVFVFSLIVYYMVGLTSGGFGLFFGVMVLTSWTGLFNCQLIAAVSPSSQSAISGFPVALFFTITFAGYMIFIPSFPDWLGTWAPYISFMRFSFQALVVNEFKDNDDLPYGNAYIDTLGFEDYSAQTCAPIPLIFMSFFAIVLLYALKCINFEER